MMTDLASWMKPPPPGNSQADQGAFTYWMRCMVCHGDQGQGLAQFRFSYPKVDQKCATSKCHGGPNPGAGFSFPDAPAIMGPGTLVEFKTAAELYSFVSTKMPYQAPGTLSQDEYWNLVTYLLRQRKALPDGIHLNAANANAVFVNASPIEWIYPTVIGLAVLILAVLGMVLFWRYSRKRAS
jgi:cytochrome c